jgi:hypothetical protein
MGKCTELFLRIRTGFFEESELKGESNCNLMYSSFSFAAYEKFNVC